MKSGPFLLIIAGPAGSGKSTLCDRLIAEFPEFSRVVTTTTRPPRSGEINGVHYHFFSPDEFKAHMERGDFIEWSLVHGTSADRLYGVLRSSVIEPLHHGRLLVMNIDVQGVNKFREEASINPLLCRIMFTVYIKVGRDRMISRMRTRNGDTEEEIARRLATAEMEDMEASKFDFILESRTRDEDFETLKSFVDQALAKIS